MSRSSEHRGQVEPLAALVAVFVLGTAVATYAIGLETARPGEDDRDRDLAATTLDAVTARLVDDGVVDPSSFDQGLAVGPEGYHLHLVLNVGGSTWEAGPSPPRTARSAIRRVSVRRWPGNVDAGRLRVEVWP